MRSPVGGRLPGDDFRHVRAQAQIAGAAQLAGLALRYGTAIVIGRLAGAAGLGLYVLATTLGAIGRVFAVLGLDRAVVRFVADAEGREDRASTAGVLVFSCVAVTAVGGVLGATVFALAPSLARWWHDPQLLGAARAMAPVVPLAALGQVARAGLRAFRDVRQAEALEQLVLPAATALAVVALLVTPLHHALLGVVAAAVASAATGVASLALLVRRTHAGVPASYAPRRWLAFSLPAWIEAGLLLLVGRAGYLFLARYADTSAVGIYGAALSIAAVVGVPLAAVNTIFGPTIAHHHARGEHARLQALYSRLTWGLLVVGAATVAVVALAAGPVLATFGARFGHDKGPLLVLLGWQLVNLGTGPTGPILVMTGQMGWKLADASVALVLTLALSWLLVPGLGPLGAAIALAVSTSLVNVIQVVQVRGLLRLWAYDPAGLRSLIPHRGQHCEPARRPIDTPNGPGPTRTG